MENFGILVCVFLFCSFRFSLVFFLLRREIGDSIDVSVSTETWVRIGRGYGYDSSIYSFALLISDSIFAVVPCFSVDST